MQRDSRFLRQPDSAELAEDRIEPRLASRSGALGRAARIRFKGRLGGVRALGEEIPASPSRLCRCRHWGDSSCFKSAPESPADNGDPGCVEGILPRPDRGQRQSLRPVIHA